MNRIDLVHVQALASMTRFGALMKCCSFVLMIDSLVVTLAQNPVTLVRAHSQCNWGYALSPTCFFLNEVSRACVDKIHNGGSK